MASKEKTKAFAYLRTSSSTNVGEDKDSAKRQREAIAEYARHAGLEIVQEFYDASVRGADPIDTRPGFAAMLEAIAGNGCRTIVVETASRFARDLIVAETGYKFLQAQGITLIAADDPDSFSSDTPTAVLIRQILGAVSQFEKAMLVSKLAGARDRKRNATGKKVEGRKNYIETYPEMVKRAKKLSRYDRLSLRKISARLAEEGWLSEVGKPYTAAAVSRMLSYKDA
ncbi:recombinase family protein [Methylobacterium nodulans]|uniref:Resolvase domain protein n=1 Tax=Methylobacterium nodulans (strain LMG 21967 / CNCM I-2342 / ORS 2060) TaxID=460265 RepID=B8IY06_METNO|nr:recombinase family protein [Methylobacterium nodulans]ACL63296.1 Resolvase domain protein [Methylobacterium nodulans ORS 2060]